MSFTPKQVLPAASLQSLQDAMDALAAAGYLNSEAVLGLIATALEDYITTSDAGDAIGAAIAPLAPLASPALTGNPTAPTQTAGANDTRIASTAFVVTAIAAAIADLVDSSPATLDTLNELAAALGEDPNFATTMATALAAKAPLASPALTGNPTAPTQTAGNNSTRISTTAFVTAAISTAIAAIAVATTSVDGLMSASDKIKLDAVGTMANREITISSSDPSGGNDGDVWVKI